MKCVRMAGWLIFSYCDVQLYRFPIFCAVYCKLQAVCIWQWPRRSLWHSSVFIEWVGQSPQCSQLSDRSIGRSVDRSIKITNDNGSFVRDQQEHCQTYAMRTTYEIVRSVQRCAIGVSVSELISVITAFNGIIRTLVYLPVRIRGEYACWFLSVSWIDYIITGPLLVVFFFPLIGDDCNTHATHWMEVLSVCMCSTVVRLLFKILFIYLFSSCVLPFSPLARHIGPLWKPEHGKTVTIKNANELWIVNVIVVRPATAVFDAIFFFFHFPSSSRWRKSSTGIRWMVRWHLALAFKINTRMDLRVTPDRIMRPLTISMRSRSVDCVPKTVSPRCCRRCRHLAHTHCNYVVDHQNRPTKTSETQKFWISVIEQKPIPARARSHTLRPVFNRQRNKIVFFFPSSLVWSGMRYRHEL